MQFRYMNWPKGWVNTRYGLTHHTHILREEVGRQGRRNFIISAQSAGCVFMNALVYTSLACYAMTTNFLCIAKLVLHVPCLLRRKYEEVID